MMLHVVGARPNYIKAAPVIRSLEKRNVKQLIANTSQHYSDNMEYAWKSTDNERERLTELALAQMQIEGDAAAAEAYSTATTASSFGKLISNLFMGGFVGGATTT